VQFGFRAERELRELRRQLEVLNSLVIQNSCNSKSEHSDEEMNRLVEELNEVKGLFFTNRFYFKIVFEWQVL